MQNLRNDGSHRLDGISVDDLAVEVQLCWSETLQVQVLHLLQNRRFAWKRDCGDWYYKVAALTCRVLEGGREADLDPSDPGSIPVEKGKNDQSLSHEKHTAPVVGPTLCLLRNQLHSEQIPLL